MGVLNVTPDSFSDGGQHADAASPARHARAMATSGADLIDIGAESTRPGSLPVPEAEQIQRLEPVFHALKADGGPPLALSVDTTQAAVAEAALEMGACLVNDTSAGRDDSAMLGLVARSSAAICLMHRRGTPATMQQAPVYDDVVAEVKRFLQSRVSEACSAGIAPERVLIDPGIGFGKSVRHNLLLLRQMSEFLSIGRPILIGTSRKGFIGHVTGVGEPSRRQFGTAATVAWAVAQGASIVRVHDVPEMVEVVRMTLATLIPPVE
jgi:dihydropteroate synthase